MDDSDEEWDKPESPVIGIICNKSPSSKKENTTIKSSAVGGHPRVIVHIDIDCFYAQVEMIRNPSLRDKPLGIQQKYIVVTCNYPAREYGVTKLMSIKDAKEKCPSLVLVCGEDLTNYRQMSYKISEYLQQYSSKVERLGFDENFIDITELVNDRISNQHGKPDDDVVGHVYGEEPSTLDSCSCGCHERLKVGSRIAADIRKGLFKELGITCCGGIAHNKLLSKLVAGAHKPNQQTTLFPESTSALMASLNSVRNIPGIGHSSGKQLKEMGVVSIKDLQDAALTELKKVFGDTMAATMKQLSSGIDESPVVAFSQPQTLSDEDSFKRCSNITEVQRKIKELLTSLLKRLVEDGRTPSTLRLTVRKMSEANKYLNRESRQCPIPNSVFRNFQTEKIPQTCGQLEVLAQGLFSKLVNTRQPFNLTLINVAFAKLEQKSKNSITNFFSSKSTNSETACSNGGKKQIITSTAETVQEQKQEAKNSITYFFSSKSTTSETACSNVGKEQVITSTAKAVQEQKQDAKAASDSDGDQINDPNLDVHRMPKTQLTKTQLSFGQLSFGHSDNNKGKEEAKETKKDMDVKDELRKFSPGRKTLFHWFTQKDRPESGPIVNESGHKVSDCSPKVNEDVDVCDIGHKVGDCSPKVKENVDVCDGGHKVSDSSPKVNEDVDISDSQKPGVNGRLGLDAELIQEPCEDSEDRCGIVTVIEKTNKDARNTSISSLFGVALSEQSRKRKHSSDDIHLSEEHHKKRKNFDEMIPNNIDREVFYQLPPSIQQEILVSNNKGQPIKVNTVKHNIPMSEVDGSVNETKVGRRSNACTDSFTTGSNSVLGKRGAEQSAEGTQSEKTSPSGFFRSRLKGVTREKSKVETNTLLRDEQLNSKCDPSAIEGFPSSSKAFTCSIPSQSDRDQTQLEIHKDTAIAMCDLEGTIDSLKNCVNQSKTMYPDTEQERSDTSLFIPPDVDRETFESLPSDIQQEMVQEWKRKYKPSKTIIKTSEKQSHIRILANTKSNNKPVHITTPANTKSNNKPVHNSTPANTNSNNKPVHITTQANTKSDNEPFHFKMPAKSSHNNIMSYFPKANR